MTNREKRKLLYADILEGITGVYIQQVCPYTRVVVLSTVDSIDHCGVGFSKVRWPDIWDAEFGIKMAVKRAVVRMVREIMRGRVVVDTPVFMEGDEVRGMLSG